MSKFCRTLTMTANITTPKFSAAEIKSEGLTLDEYQMICDRLNREPNKAELGMFGVMWSHLRIAA